MAPIPRSSEILENGGRKMGIQSKWHVGSTTRLNANRIRGLSPSREGLCGFCGDPLDAAHDATGSLIANDRKDRYNQSRDS